MLTLQYQYNIEERKLHQVLGGGVVIKGVAFDDERGLSEAVGDLKFNSILSVKRMVCQ